MWKNEVKNRYNTRNDTSYQIKLLRFFFKPKYMEDTWGCLDVHTRGGMENLNVVRYARSVERFAWGQIIPIIITPE